MKIVLLQLSGDSRLARDMLVHRYPHAHIEEVSRLDLESQRSLRARINIVRSHHPNLFAVSTEKLAWQRGQTVFLLFGAIAGAQLSVIFDAHGGWREETRARILASAPARVAHETLLSADAILRARRKLNALEQALARAKNAVTQQTVTAEVSRQSPNIVYVRGTPGPGTYFGGAASHTKGVTEALLRLGARLRFVSNDQLPGPVATPQVVFGPEPLGITRATFDLHNGLLFADRAVSEIERDPPDVIYERYSRFGSAGVAASLRTGRPLFLEYNGSEVWVGRHWDRVGMLGLLERYERLNLATAARVFVVSEVDRRNLLQTGIKAEKIVVNPNGVDPERFRPGVGGEKIRAELALRADEILVGFIGSFGPWHGVEVLAEAIKLLADEKQIRFLLIGSGALRGEVEQSLKAECEVGLVIFTGPVEHERIPAFLDACDVLVSPHVPLAGGAEFFGSPTKLYEYMAMGKGIIASRLGQIGDVLTDGQTALLVQPGDQKQLSEAILRLAHSRELRERLGAAARVAAVERHTWTNNAQRVLDAYRAWLGN
jgi:glycosyltransferase involved in cell wall biosynthesis